MPSCPCSGSLRGVQVAGHNRCLNALLIRTICLILCGLFLNVPLYNQETSLNEHELESDRHVVEPVSPRSSKEPEQPSPVSVLEPPNEAELSSSECFESISAGLHG